MSKKLFIILFFLIGAKLNCAAKIESETPTSLLIKRLLNEHVANAYKHKKGKENLFKCSDEQLSKFKEKEEFNLIIDTLRTNNISINTRDHAGKTIITRFVINNKISLEIIDFLIKLGSDLKNLDRSNSSIFCDLLVLNKGCRSDEAMLKLIILLIKNGALLTIGSNTVKIASAFQDLLFQDLEHSQFDLIKMVLAFASEEYILDKETLNDGFINMTRENLTDKASMTPLMWLLIKKFIKLSKKMIPLINDNIIQNLSISNICGDTALTLSEQLEDKEILKILSKNCMPIIEQINLGLSSFPETKDINHVHLIDLICQYLFGVNIKEHSA